MENRIIGQKDLIRSMMLCLLCDGHMLIEGMPGLAKTTAAKTLAESIEGEFQRIQFTPDLLPSDLIGTDIYLHETSTFEFRKGPLFHHIILADEINRAPAKVQSALLEAMEEKQVSVGLHTYPLPPLYMVLATQNPIEQEGTYNLPEAQLDRFLMHAVVSYPDHEEEMKILELDEKLASHPEKKNDHVSAVVTQEEIFAARRNILEVYMDPKIKHYAVSLVSATRKPGAYSEQLYDWILHGASPRATLGLVHTARALAWLEGDGYVSPHHIQQVAPNILRHRIIPTFEAEAGGVTRDRIIAHLLEVVAVP
ncbi:MAG: MoxR family ATPase [Rhodospirillales bacterium]|nr:MoxR family ATPase [Alphaproteobacteria bacterium]MCB1840526.1 MoxR family ATPase [Alphaproteobacteria bacterium]MCB9977130.1 MoxR family ATPase [Rhodospirillales bacterium]